MARNQGKKALYEVMSKARQKPGKDRSLEQMPPKNTGENRPNVESKSVRVAAKGTVQWSRRPRLIQYNAGRIEFSIPYQVAIALALALLLMILAFYRLGQFSYRPENQEQAQPSGLMRQIEQRDAMERASIEVAPPSPPSVENTAPRPERTETNVEPNPEGNASTGNNVIVLVEYDKLADLTPVQAHFEEHGIMTDIDIRNGRYFLQTVEKYDNPNTSGTDGYKAKQKIIEIGRTYKAPPGYETFAPHFFSDAYGKRVP
jgi:hypothetical protein